MKEFFNFLSLVDCFSYLLLLEFNYKLVDKGEMQFEEFSFSIIKRGKDGGFGWS